MMMNENHIKTKKFIPHGSEEVSMVDIISVELRIR